jgi:RHS repeat-associated protein
VDAVGITNTFAYDAAGNRTSVKDGQEPDDDVCVRRVQPPHVADLCQCELWRCWRHDDVHLQRGAEAFSKTSPRGITTTYTYDSRDRVTATSAPGLQRNHSYDVAGRLLSVSEPANATANVSYTYDVLGRVLSETSRGLTHSYAYDIAGNRTQASYGTGRVVTTTYDAFNRPLTINEGGRTTSYGYDLGGGPSCSKRATARPAATCMTLGRLKQRTLYRTDAMSAGDELAHFEWTHDLLGNVTSQSETWPGEPTRPGTRVTSMAYDANNRLTNETIDDPTAGVTATAYAYDHANNRTSKVVTGGTEPGLWSYVYNAANQLTSWAKSLNGSPVKTAALTYDDAGNRIAQSVQEYLPDSTPSALSSTLYSWDAQDRLSSVTMPDGSQHAYKYDYRTRRISTTRSGGILPSIIHRHPVRGRSESRRMGGGRQRARHGQQPTVEYTRGPDMGGGVGGMLYSLRGATAKYSLSNGRGDIVAQADQGATLTWTASYEAYGKRTKETGTNQDKQRANSKDEDPTGLLNEGFRYRDIETGVWLSRDPAGFVDGPNLYAYVQQNPWTKL